MIMVSVTYPASDGHRFDWAYYTDHHIPLVEQAFGETGLQGVWVLKGVSALDGGPAASVAIANLAFADADAVQASLAGPKAAAVIADIANFTDIQPVIQLNTRL